PEPEDPVAGKVMAHNPCLSGGTLEIFLEPHRPAPLVAVFGQSPIARALVDVGTALGYELVALDPAADGSPPVVPAEAEAVVVASHGRDEPDVLRAALDAGVGY